MIHILFQVGLFLMLLLLLIIIIIRKTRGAMVLNHGFLLASTDLY